ncbi:MAG: hypothetical protein SFW64_00865 [Alphaproteobacteria bacterium]|nr:hypothetical protein [Alphaproteobacteria bacterium]
MMAEETDATRTPVPDSGKADYDLYTIRGNGKRGKEWEGDGLRSVYNAWSKANPGKYNYKEFAAWVIEHNDLKTVKGVPCKGDPTLEPNLILGSTIKLPEGNEIGDFELLKICHDKPSVPLVTPIVAEASPVQAAPLELSPREVEVRPLHQLIVNSQGTVRDAVLLDGADYFVGRPPRDVAAESPGERDKLRERGKRRNGLHPGTHEGTAVNTGSGKGDRAASALDTLQVPFLGGMIDPEGNHVDLRRANKELEFAPGKHIRLDGNGNPVGPNTRNNQKMESGVSLAVDADGAVRTVQDMSALISLNRRNNPDYHGLFGVLGIREALTARNRNLPLTNTGEGVALVTTYLGAERAYEKIDTAFKAAPNAADAEKLLQLNVQMAMHPLVWSVDSYGVPVDRVQTLRDEMQRIVARLPEDEDKTRLSETYVAPYWDVLDNPTRLNEAIGEHGGRADWINPMQDWKAERLEEDFIVKGYGDTPETRVSAPHRHHKNAGGSLRERREARQQQEALRREEAERVGTVYANQMWEKSIRPPTASETALGSGLLHDVQGQKEENLAPARLKLLRHLRDDPKARAAWVEHMLATPGGMQNISDLLHFSSNTKSGNYQLLGYAGAGEAAAGARDIASRLAGEDQGEALLHQKHRFLDGLGRFLTLGIASPGKNRNQNNGLFGFSEATAARWNDSDTHAVVDGAVTEVLDRAIAVAEAGGPVGNIAATALVLTMDADRAENAGATATSMALRQMLSPADSATIDNQMVANLDTAGGRYVSAAVAQATQEGVLKGAKILTVERSQVAAVVAGGGALALSPEQAEKLGGTGPVMVTTLPTDRPADAAARASVLTLSGNPALVSQNQLDALNVTRMAEVSPVSFAVLLTNTIVAADASGNKELAAALRAQVDSLTSGQGRAGRQLAKLVRERVEATHAGNGAAPVVEASATAFGAFFNDSNKSHADVHALSANTLARFIGNEPKASAALMATAASVMVEFPAEAQDQLLAIGEIADSAQRAAAQEAFGKKFAAQINTLHAKNGVSIVETVKMALLIAALTHKKPQDKPLDQERPPTEPPPKTELPIDPELPSGKPPVLPPPKPPIPPEVPPPPPKVPGDPIGMQLPSIDMPAGTSLPTPRAIAQAVVDKGKGVV